MVIQRFRKHSGHRQDLLNEISGLPIARWTNLWLKVQVIKGERMHYVHSLHNKQCCLVSYFMKKYCFFVNYVVFYYKIQSAGRNILIIRILAVI
jgi:hypothetical protein